ncbi:MAG: endonuclease MutS2, partial [Thermacetogeniaceae bacterium]
MDRYSLKKLEFHKIKEMLETLCETPLGVHHVRELEPSADINEVLEAQAETTEAVKAKRLSPDLSLAGISDLTPFLRRAAIGGVLEPNELLMIRDTLAAAGRVKEGILRISADIPRLRSRAAALNECSQLQERIGACILPEGEIADAASAELAKLRRQMRSLEAKARSQLEEFLTRPEWLRYLQEPIYTMRGERYVLPVKQEFRNQFPGIVHDQSSSGATVFMEPLSLVSTMNELAAVKAAARREELRVLEELTKLVAAEHERIGENLKILGEIDFIFAKGALSERMKGRQPEIKDDGWIEIRGGRHPLLQGEVVPLNIHLGKDFDCLIITGPNTGGKTVALKTVGLLALMAQAGLHVPADEGTVFPCFMDIFADIGDEQSIEQSLSTFSGHMTNIVRILQKAGKGTLVILDELGAGTDPEQGAS